MEEGRWDVVVGKVAIGDPSGVSGDALRERNLLEVTEMGFLSSFFEC